MIRRLLHVAAVLLLMVAAVLTAAGLAGLPHRPLWIGDPAGTGWVVGVHLGKVRVLSVAGGAIRSVPFAAHVRTLALPFALPALAWALVLYRLGRRRAARGFPVEVSSYAQAVEPAANRSAQATGGEAGQTP